jgi:hypothetical protein
MNCVRGILIGTPLSLALWGVLLYPLYSLLTR